MRYVNTQFQKIPKYFDASEMCYFVSCSIRERMCILVAIFFLLTGFLSKRIFECLAASVTFERENAFLLMEVISGTAQKYKL